MNRCSAKLIPIALLTAWLMNGQDLSTFIDEARQSYRDVKDNILKSAEWMPEQSYNFRPTSSSRSFGQLIGEVARSQANVCSAIDGDRSPLNGPYSESKPDLIQVLEKSMRRCDSAYASVNAFNANEQVGFGNIRHSKLGLLFLNATHDNELYGRLAVYLRLNGILPPSDRPRVVPVD